MIKKSKDLKTKKIEVLCTEDQFKKITLKAKRYGMSSSEFGLFTMMNSNITVSVGKDPYLGKIQLALKMLDEKKW